MKQPFSCESESKGIFILGGCSNEFPDDEFFFYNHNTKTCQKLSLKLPYEAMNHGAVCMSNEIYIFGGEEDVGCARYNRAFKLTAKMEWVQLRDMKERRSGITNTSLVLNGFIWVIGGHNGEEPLKSVEKFDSTTGRWNFGIEMNEAREGAAAAVINDKIYVCGGSGIQGTLRSTEVFDPSTGVWSTFQPLLAPRHDLAAISHGSSLIVLGGIEKYASNPTVWKIDTENSDENWIERIPMKQGKGHFTACRLGNDIIVVGGQYIEIFDGKTWLKGPLLPRIRYFSCVIIAPKDLLQSLYNKNLL